ncbi:MAG: phenylalanine--tRNA ligase beta subunit-related protein [Planctomycetota bacterium]
MTGPIPLSIDEHPSLHLGAFVATLPEPLDAMPSPAWLTDLLREDASAPMERSEEIRAAVRDLLRVGGYKPTGRGKPASEYLVRAASQGKLGPINLIVDACNAVSLHSGLPISVVDLDRVAEPLRVGLGAPEASYVFNTGGQEIKVAGLLCLHDADGPCANAVKDSQRTKTSADTRRALCLVWGCEAFAEHTDRAVAWYRELLERADAKCAAFAP